MKQAKWVYRDGRMVRACDVAFWERLLWWALYPARAIAERRRKRRLERWVKVDLPRIEEEL